MSDPPQASERYPLLPSSSNVASSSNLTSTSSPLSKHPTSTSRPNSITSVTPSEEEGDLRGGRKPPQTSESDQSASLWRKTLRFLLIWGTVAGIVVFCIVQSIRKGNGEFDWKGALKKAGGGVSLFYLSPGVPTELDTDVIYIEITSLPSAILR